MNQYIIENTKNLFEMEFILKYSFGININCSQNANGHPVDRAFISTANACTRYLIPDNSFGYNFRQEQCFRLPHTLFALKQYCILSTLRTIRYWLSSKTYCELPTLYALQGKGFFENFFCPRESLSTSQSPKQGCYRIDAFPWSSYQKFLPAEDESYCNEMRNKIIHFSSKAKKFRFATNQSAYHSFLNAQIGWTTTPSKKKKQFYNIPIYKSDSCFYLISNGKNILRATNSLFSSDKEKYKNKQLTNLINIYNKMLPSLSRSDNRLKIGDKILLSLSLEDLLPINLLLFLSNRLTAHPEIHLEELEMALDQIVAFPDPFVRNYFLDAAFNSFGGGNVETNYFDDLKKTDSPIAYEKQDLITTISPKLRWYNLLENYLSFLSEITLPVFSNTFLLELLNMVSKRNGHKVFDFNSNAEQFQKLLIDCCNSLCLYMKTNSIFYLWNSKELWNDKKPENPFYSEAPLHYSHDNPDFSYFNDLEYKYRKYLEKSYINNGCACFSAESITRWTSTQYKDLDLLSKHIFNRSEHYRYLHDDYFNSHSNTYNRYLDNIAKANILQILNSRK